MGANQHLGEAEFHIGSASYIARIGVREWAEMETAFGVEGTQAVWEVASKTTYKAWLTYARIALSRHHPDLSDTDLADILDYREGDKNIASDALIRAMNRAMPATDPNAQPAATTTPVTPESKPSA